MRAPSAVNLKKSYPNSSSWISWFLSSKGNEYFCEVEDDYILDRFNLTGLNTEVQNYTQALDLITDNLGAFDPSSCHPLPANSVNLDDDFQEELRGTLDIQARLLYGLIHARWIVTARGLAKMVRLCALSTLYDQNLNYILKLQLSPTTYSSP